MSKTIKCTIGSFFTGKCNDKDEKPRGVLLECEGRELIIKDGEEVSSDQLCLLVNGVSEKELDALLLELNEKTAHLLELLESIK